MREEPDIKRVLSSFVMRLSTILLCVMTMQIAILLLISGCALLGWGADRFVTGASVVARNFGISPLVIGIVLVGFATSLPEMLVSAIASWQGTPQMAIGNAVGSNITNIGLVIGICAMIRPLSVHSRLLKREYPILLGIMLFVLLLLLDHQLDRFDGLWLFVAFLFLLAWMVRLTKSKEYIDDPVALETAEEISTTMTTQMAIFWWFLGFVLLLISSRMLVEGAVFIAHYFGVSDLVIGLTIVALGTSLPELAAAVVSTFKNEPDIVLGNVIGSNMFNLLPVMMMPAWIAPTAVPNSLLQRDFVVMLVLTILLFIFSLGSKGRGRINRLEGGLFLAIYVGFVVTLFRS